jgi:hypothetical protein
MANRFVLVLILRLGIKPCKHIHAVEFILQREVKPDGTTVETKTMRITYNQNWHNYNNSQIHEQEHFVDLLRDLCNGIPQPEQTFGRPRLPQAEVVFGLAYRTYSTMSGRRFMSDLREAETKELVSKSASFTSNARSLLSKMNLKSYFRQVNQI